jgi:hypothetical protein
MYVFSEVSAFRVVFVKILICDGPGSAQISVQKSSMNMLALIY